MRQTPSAERAGTNVAIPGALRAKGNRPSGASRAPRRRRLRLAAALTACLSSIANARAEPPPVCEREMARAAQANGIPLDILYSVGLTETGHKGALSPYDMNVDGRSVHAARLDEALARIDFMGRN
jgi:hypothetical protein